jgi:hypothetical protein
MYSYQDSISYKGSYVSGTESVKKRRQKKVKTPDLPENQNGMITVSEQGKIIVADDTQVNL